MFCCLVVIVVAGGRGQIELIHRPLNFGDAMTEVRQYLLAYAAKLHNCGRQTQFGGNISTQFGFRFSTTF